MNYFIKHTVFFLILFCFSENISAQNNKPVLLFGIIADIQYCDCETSGNRYYRNSLGKLKECVSDLNRNDVDFTINLGDLIDRKFEDLHPIMLSLKGLKTKVYNTTGNHDYSKTIDNKLLYKKLNIPEEYYSFKKKNWKFIVLNTNEIASYSNISGTEKEQELEDMMNKIKADKRKNGYTWNGGISKKQLEWLDKQLAKAQEKKENVLIFCHHPLFPENNHNALNDREILEVIGNYRCVKAVFSGHNHAGNFGHYGNITFVTIEGMVETENENAYGIIDIYDNKINITGKGRVTSRQLDF